MDTLSQEAHVSDRGHLQAQWHPGWSVPVPGVRFTVPDMDILTMILATAPAPLKGTGVAWSNRWAIVLPAGRRSHQGNSPPGVIDVRAIPLGTRGPEFAFPL